MRHQWEEFSDWRRGIATFRRCRVCRSVQKKLDNQDWGRVTGYSWYPKAGRCGLNRRWKLRRYGPGDYRTEDGLFCVWHELRPGHENRWYVNHKDFDETLQLGGFPGKAEAIWFLESLYTERPDWIFGVVATDGP